MRRLTVIVDGKGLCFGAAKLIAMSQHGNHNNEAEAPKGASPDALPVLCTHPAHIGVDVCSDLKPGAACFVLLVQLGTGHLHGSSHVVLTA